MIPWNEVDGRWFCGMRAVIDLSDDGRDFAAQVWVSGEWIQSPLCSSFLSAANWVRYYGIDAEIGMMQ